MSDAIFYDRENRPWSVEFDDETMAGLQARGLLDVPYSFGALVVILARICESQRIERGLGVRDFALMLLDDDVQTGAVLALESSWNCYKARHAEADVDAGELLATIETKA